MKHPIDLYTKLNSLIQLICYIDGQSWLQVEDAHYLPCFLAERMNHITGIMNHLMTCVLIYQIMLERPILKHKAISHSIAAYGLSRLLGSLTINCCVNQGVIRACKQ